MSKKIIGASVVLTLIAAVFAGVAVSTASAQSMSLCQTVDALVLSGVISADKVAAAKAAAGCSSTASAAYTFTKDLTVGSTGADVTALQNKLGVTPATGYFGAITKAAVMAYQSANGLPATGFVGPMTRAKLNYVAPSVPSTPSTPSNPSTSSNDLDGTDGNIADVNTLSQYNNEEVGESESDVKVLGADVEVSKDGDIALKSVKIKFTSTGSNQSTRIADYIDGVSVWLGNTKIGSADASDFNKDKTGIYTKTITLKNAVIRADKTAKLIVAVDAVSNLDSNDIEDEDWDVSIDNVRYVDGSGVTTTDDSSGDLPVSAPIDFVSFSVSADTEFKVSLDSSSPKAGVTVVDDQSNTDNVVLLKGKIKIDGTSDVLVDELPITLTTTATSVSGVTNNVTLTIDGEDYSESVTATSSSATTTFDNLDLTLTAGKTYSFTISADINDIEAGSFDEGDSLTASLTSTNRGAVDVENEEGDQLTSSERTGTALGEAQTFYTSGINVTINSASASVTSNDGTANDSVTYTVNLTVEAFGDDVYVSHATTTDSSYQFSGGTPVVNESRLAAKDTDTQDDGSYNYFFISDGDSRDFTYTVILSASGTASTISNFKMTDLGWGLTPTSINSYNGDLDDSSVSASKLLN